MPAALIGAAMAAFYVVPAVAELRLIQASRLTADTLDYHRHFVDPGQWFRWTWGYVAEEMSFQVGVIQWAAIAATGACALWALRGGRGRTLLGESLWWLLVVLFGLFMTTTRSLPVWEAVKPLAFIQFPWRYMMLVSIGLRRARRARRRPPCRIPTRACRSSSSCSWHSGRSHPAI